MALIKCVECGKEISSEASNCPSCGRPIHEKIVTIEATSKVWKIIKLLSWLGVITGIMMYANQSEGLANILLLFSIIGLIVAKIGRWWTNR